MALLDLIRRIEATRHSRVLVFGSSQLEIDLLPALYDTLSGMAINGRLDVLFYSRGGVINAARRIALLFREFSDRVSFLVPHYCESAGTVAALSADEVVAGPLAIFSPVDPILTANQAGRGGPLALSAQDLRLFEEMSRNWFGMEDAQAKSHALATLSSNIFPTTLTSFYRSTLEIEAICMEMIALHRPGAASADECRQIARTLIFGFHSHTYALTRDELEAIGVPVTRDAGLEPLMWAANQILREVIGPGARSTADSEWQDALIASSDGATVRRRSEDFPGRWHAWEEH